ncbi:tyrosine-type recombinase/integrase [Microvirga roseola]|uniref:tyrosine-type recombinase/integrase n=1 Tax=Microvirga roseola TaxID=2883126 RepID=UPI001E2C3B21|nr:site-specific integrase [Microvirga roseola]
MATIRKRGSSWHVQIRRQGYPPLTKTFSSRTDAAIWARDTERAIDRAELPVGHRELKSATVRDLLKRYELEITTKKRGADRERFKIRVISAHSIAKASLDKVSGAMVARYRDDRLKLVTSATVRRELAILQHCFEVARREWDFPIGLNPVRQITLPEPSRARQRRLAPEEIGRFWAAVDRARAWYVKPLIILAVETGMRRGELLSIRWDDVDASARTIKILTTKNGHPRVIPLTPKAIRTLNELPHGHDRVFPAKATAVRQAWDRLIQRSGLSNLRFHDLRHEAVSRFFEAGLNVPEVALISGHRDPRMLFRYTHPRAEAVAEKLAVAERKRNVGVLPRSTSDVD